MLEWLKDLMELYIYIKNMPNFIQDNPKNTFEKQHHSIWARACSNWMNTIINTL